VSDPFRLFARLLAALLLPVPLFSPTAQPLADAGADRTLAPYFVVGEAEPGVDALPLKSTQVDVKVGGVIADVRVGQTYRNEGTVPIEARYVFPASTRAAVYALRMRVADRVVDAEIREKQQARREFDAARRAGKRASLLEQHRPNVFRMSIANVMPGETIAVDLRYTETIVPDEGVYRFVFPTVVGPRYNGGTAPHEGAGTPRATARLDADAAHANRDVVLEYRLAGESIEAGVLVHEGPDENFFLALMRQRLRVRHRLVGQPPSDRRARARGQGRAVLRAQCPAGRRRGRTAAKDDRGARAHAHPRALRRLRRLRPRRAGHSGSLRAAADRADRQVPRQGRRDDRNRRARGRQRGAVAAGRRAQRARRRGDEGAEGCAGIGMLWVGGYTAALLSYLTGASARRTLANGLVAAGAVFAANVLRNALLFFPESGLVHAPAWAHGAIGLAAFAAAIVPIVAFVHWRRA
jgi:exosortase/archaeosortase family protein